jgi:serine phosphatase RsbU (regulator of sigma subunit)
VQLNCSELWGGNRPADAPVASAGLRGRIFSQPSGGVRGGDVHYLSVCGSGLLSRIVVADVAGHGETVSRVSGEIHSMLRRYMDRLGGELSLLRELNERLIDGRLHSMVTAAVVGYYPPSRTLSVSYAGHPAAWFYRRGTQRWSRLEADAPPAGGDRPYNLPLAVEPKTAFTRRRERVEFGDRLLLLTDGVTDTRSDRRELFGEERVTDVLERNHNAALGDLSSVLVSELRAFSRDPALRHDDVTSLLFEFVPGPPGPAVWTAIRNRLFQPRFRSAAPT